VSELDEPGDHEVLVGALVITVVILALVVAAFAIF
jgi:hypothetical protein